jgi:hypothetical protein
MKHVLLINAHHFYENISLGRLNRTMAGAPCVRIVEMIPFSGISI